MSLTWKLILGFLFALVLQVVQMTVSSYFTAQMQEATAIVSTSLKANIAVQRGTEAARDLHKRLQSDITRSKAQIDTTVYQVYVDELLAQKALLWPSIEVADRQVAAQLADGVAALEKQFAEVVRVVRSGGEQEAGDAVAFLDDALQDIDQALLRTQIVVSQAAEAGVLREEQVHDLPMRASLVITLVGVVTMALFVAWFSRQLVLPIQRAWAELERRVAERTRELADTVVQLEGQIVERRRVEAQKEDLHQQLVETSRRAGMAELANGVLHNVGNVLNSVNVSANVLLDRLRKSKADGLHKAVQLIHQHERDLGEFLTTSTQGRKLPGYLDQLAAHLLQERDVLLGETKDLSLRIDHMKEIVSRQQSYTRVAGVQSLVRLSTLVDDVLRTHEASFGKLDIRAARQIEWDGECEIDRSRVMQILMNLVTNAKQALGESQRGGGVIEIGIRQHGQDRIQLRVVDNGVGISQENLAKVFAHGFTTKNDGHGFGLHHSANAAAEMGGRLWAESGGPGLGATFVLELPARCPAGAAA
ncbi:MAG: ATP-binding protein [Planctomycetota bacterium]|nr:ATP-binding protein [Planctomycetota bacterium]